MVRGAVSHHLVGHLTIDTNTKPSITNVNYFLTLSLPLLNNHLATVLDDFELMTNLNMLHLFIKNSEVFIRKQVTEERFLFSTTFKLFGFKEKGLQFFLDWKKFVLM